MSETLQKLSNDLAATVQSVDPAIVRVEARRRMPASGIVWSADGVIVTAHHIVERDEKIKVGLADGATTSATLVGRDPTTDLAVLRADATDLTPPKWASFEADGVRVGHLALALGRPGKSTQATLGIISALSADWRAPSGSQLDYYVQTDVVMYPGFSGGPLVDAGGAVVGLNTSALLRGISLTVPAPTITKVVAALLEHGHIKRGYLGVNTQPVRLPAGLAEQLNQETGLLLAGVEPDSPADKGGLLLGDTIVAFEETPVRQHDDLLAQLSPDRVGNEASIKIIRGGNIETMKVTITERK